MGSAGTGRPGRWRDTRTIDAKPFDTLCVSGERKTFVDAAIAGYVDGKVMCAGFADQCTSPFLVGIKYGYRNSTRTQHSCRCGTEPRGSPRDHCRGIGTESHAWRAVDR